MSKRRQVSDSKPCPRTDVDCPQGMVVKASVGFDLSKGELVPIKEIVGQGYGNIRAIKPLITPEDLWSALALGGGEPPKPDGTNDEEIAEWNRLMKLAQPALEGDTP